MNGLQEVVNVTTPNKWYSNADFSIIVGYQLKNAGVPWRTRDELMDCMQILHDIDFVEDNTDHTAMRVKLKYYGT